MCRLALSGDPPPHTSLQARGDDVVRHAQSVARWEKGQTKMVGPADRLLRLLYESHATEKGREYGIPELLVQLPELDDTDNLDEVQFEDTNRGWSRAA
ncbi:MAG: hypothetical protein OXH15_18630 [Gammaproteobacteria bacterium]|nr:hypothetical protein [Gammaproteobacteria bacterium]